MELTIKIPDSLAPQLKDEADRRGIAPQECASQIIQEHLPAAERAKALRDMFAEWAAEDATNDPEELARRQEEWEELKHALNANRTSGRKLFNE